jgi:hypothetical protein
MATKRVPGNGSGKFNAHTQDMGGWLRVFADATASVPENLPVFLSHALTEWFRQRPQLRMRNVVPVTRNGDVVELHCWFDMQVFPDLSGQTPKPSTPDL